MERSWLNLPRDDVRYKNGISEFVQFVKQNGGVGELHPCPCKICRNTQRLSLEDISWHLFEKGMMTTYTMWFEHGEVSNDPSIYRLRKEYLIGHREEFTASLSYCPGSASNVVFETMSNQTRQMIEDAFHFPNGVRGVDGCVFMDVENNVGDDMADGNCGNVAYEKYKRLVAAAQTPISEASGQTVLNYLIQLMQGKIKNRWSDKSINYQLAINRPLLPKVNKYPRNYGEVKKILKNLGMEYINIHACVSGCILYYKENEALDGCPICEEPRYAVNDGKKKVPNKVVKYFPLAPRLRRLYMSPVVAKAMRWHAERDVSSGSLLRHPSDGEAWKDFDKAFPDFACEIRNVRLAIATDGFNPFGAPNISYSTWPIVITPLNLPPSMCMRKEFNILAMLISGPFSPGKCLNVFMRPLIDELGMLWSEGIPTFDRRDCSSFTLRAAVLSTISDFPGLGMLAGHRVKGYRACPVCVDDITSDRIADRTVYQGHRRWLPTEHPWRQEAARFNGHVELKDPPRMLSGREIHEKIDSHTYHVPSNHKQFANRKVSELVCWSHKTIFYELPYWDSLAQPYSLDVMHIEKNVFDNLVGTILGIEDKTKDGPKAREALREQGVRPEQWISKENLMKSKKVLPAPFTVSGEDRKEIFEWIRATKFPHGYAASLKNKINVQKTNFNGLKTHDCHVMLQRLIPVVIRPFLPSHVVLPIIDLGKWFQRICCRELNVEDVISLKKEIVIILCKFERIFPPTFFTSMVHLLVHLPDQILLKGPVHYSWMYPIERQLGEYKKSVRNTRFPEGCIAEQYIAQECVTYCNLYLDLPHGNVEEEIQTREFEISVCSKVVKAGAVIRNLKLGPKYLDMAHWCVLDNCTEASYFVAKHKDKWYAEYPHSTVAECWENFADSYFLPWITSLGKKQPRSTYWKLELYYLAAKPQIHNCHTQCWVNGVKFVVHSRDEHLVTQNSGVMVEAGDDEVYYGVIEQIITLTYTEGMEVVVFRCRWFNSTNPGEDGSVRIDHGLISIDTSSNWYVESPFCLALAARQVYYLDDPKLGEAWRVVHSVSHRGVFSEACFGVNEDAIPPSEEEAPEPYQEPSPDFVR